MKYFGNWKCKKDVADDFNVDVSVIGNVLLAWYGYGDYSGNAFVLFESNGKLYEVYGGHCSCHGLEDQWKPEEASGDALARILKEGYHFHSEYDAGQVAYKALERIVKRLQKK